MNSKTPNTNNVTTREEECIPMLETIQEKKLGEKFHPQMFLKSI